MADGNGKDDLISIPLITGGGSAQSVELAIVARGTIQERKERCSFCPVHTHRVIASKPPNGDTFDRLIYCCDFCFRAIRTMTWQFEGE
jgi:hypothetical protein